VKSALNDVKILLKFATLSVIESLRINPKLYNFVFYDISNNNNTNASYVSNYFSLISSEQHQRSFNDSYTSLILEEAEKLYNMFITKLTNTVVAASADMRASLLQPVNQDDIY
jgi:hypothetical protein